MMKTALLASGIALSASAGTAATVNTVDLELVLVTDVSGSINSADYNLIRNGYAAAFRDADVIDTILNGKFKKIAVNVIQFSTNAAASLGGVWTIIDSAASSLAFADALEGMARSSNGNTGTTRGMQAATAALVADNSIASTRQVIDFAIDGEDNVACANQSQQCQPLKDARDAAVAAGVDGINALMIADPGLFGDVNTTNNPNFVFATQYAQQNLIAGNGAFSNLIDDFGDFAPAIASKLVREIAPPPPQPVPLPAAGWMLVAGIGGLAAMARRRKAAA